MITNIKVVFQWFGKNIHIHNLPRIICEGLGAIRLKICRHNESCSIESDEELWLDIEYLSNLVQCIYIKDKTVHYNG